MSGDRACTRTSCQPVFVSTCTAQVDGGTALSTTGLRATGRSEDRRERLLDERDDANGLGVVMADDSARDAIGREHRVLKDATDDLEVAQWRVSVSSLLQCSVSV